MLPLYIIHTKKQKLGLLFSYIMSSSNLPFGLHESIFLEFGCRFLSVQTTSSQCLLEALENNTEEILGVYNERIWSCKNSVPFECVEDVIVTGSVRGERELCVCGGGGGGEGSRGSEGRERKF